MAARDDGLQLQRIGVSRYLAEAVHVQWPGAAINWTVVRRRSGIIKIGVNFTHGDWTDTDFFVVEGSNLTIAPAECLTTQEQQLRQATTPPRSLTAEQLAVLNQLADRTD